LLHPEIPLFSSYCRTRKILYPLQVVASGKSFILSKLLHPEIPLSSSCCRTRKFFILSRLSHTEILLVP
jgi:hypothetical protein